MKGSEFGRLFKESVIVQATMALGLLVTICYLYIVGREPPAALVQAFMLILGFYFGSKAQTIIDRKEG